MKTLELPHANKALRLLPKAVLLAAVIGALIWIVAFQIPAKMTPKTAVVQLLNGLTLGVMYVLIASGLSLIFGLMDIINFAHGTLYMLGAYFGLMLYKLTGSFWLALAVAPLLVGALGMLLERLTFRPLYGRTPLYHILLTFGLVLVLTNAAELLWGKSYVLFTRPPELSGIARFLGIVYPKYKLFVLAMGAAVMGLFGLLIKKTRFGLVIRAGAYDREITSAFGIDISKYFTLVFGFGVALAAAAGVVLGPILSVNPHMGDGIIITAFVVVVVGGLGSLPGAVLAGLLIGVLESFSKILFPAFTGAMMYIVMALVLILRPQGLMGSEELQ